MIEISSAGGSIGDIRVIETHGITGKHAYACLSYCWGDTKQAGMTTSGSFPRPLKLEELPKTIADTIRLCHKLGYQYLWVDSLCIVQDDSRDWHREASKMCDIYGGSALTIATPICKDSSQSFLEQRRRRAAIPENSVRLDYTDTHLGEPGSILVYMAVGNDFKYHTMWSLEYKWSEFDSYGPEWMRRAWTFQEWMLSPRVLHIEGMTLWDCFEGYGNEITQRKMTPPKLQRNVNCLESEIEWEDIVKQFTKRKITSDKDRLPALAGIAERYRQRTGHTYLAGLWLEDMPRALLWHKYGRGGRSSGYTQGRIPSWSWASFEGPVYPENLYGKEPEAAGIHASVKSWFCEYNPPDSLLEVTKAWIELEGPVVLATDYDAKYHQIIAGSGKRVSIKLDEGFSLGEEVAAKNIYLMLVDHVYSSPGHAFGHALILQSISLVGEDGGCYFRKVGKAGCPGLHIQEWERRSIILV